MSELKKYTRLGSNSRQLAALLQAKAPKGHMLAYINPTEAALLKARGGSGQPHSDTGIPSYENEFDTMSYGMDMGEQIPYTQEQVGDLYPTESGLSALPAQQISGGFIPTIDVPSVASAPTFGGTQAADAFPDFGLATGVGAPGTTQTVTPTFQPTVAPPTEELGLADRAAKATGMSKDTLARLGLAGGLGLMGQRQARAAQLQGQAGKAEMQQLATPYQRAGAQAQQAAQRGELLPVGQQSLQAAQAQMAQDIQRRGGVGAQQAANQMANLRQQLLQQQYDYGLKLSGIGDNIALGAIRTGLQADQYVNQLTNSFYSNMAYIASGMTPATRTGGQQ